MHLSSRLPDRVAPPVVFITALLIATFLFAAAAFTTPSNVLGGTRLYTKCDGVALRTRASTVSRRAAVLPADVRVNAVSRVTGGSWRVTCAGKSYSGNTWYRINNVKGRSASSRYGVTYVYAATALFRTTSTTTSPTPTPATSCGSSLQARIDAAPSGGTIDLTGCSYSAGAKIAKPLTVVGATVRVPAGEQGFRVSASDVTLARLTIIGPQATTYRANEFGVMTSAAVSNLVIRDSTIKTFGNSGIWVGPVKDAKITGNRIEDTVYSGIMLVSANGGRVAANIVRRVGVYGSGANYGNAYGIALSNTGGAVSADVLVDGNTVEKVPTWHGLDTHAGLRITFSNNTVSGAPRALFITTDASGRRSSGVVATGNSFNSPSPATTNLITVTTYNALNATVTNNRATGWGSAAFFHDYNGMSSGLVVKENSVTP